MRYLAIDWGTKRVGLAISDAEGNWPAPLEVLANHGPAELQRQLRAVIEREKIQRVIVGLPLNMDGTEGPSCRAARQLGGQLTTGGGADVVYVDERLSSFAAEDQLRDRQREGQKWTRGQKKKHLDALAATVILRDYLQSLKET